MPNLHHLTSNKQTWEPGEQRNNTPNRRLRILETFTIRKDLTIRGNMWALNHASAAENKHLQLILETYQYGWMG